MAGKGGYVSFVPKPQCLQGEHKKAIFAKISGSSTSSGGEERKPSDQEGERKKLRAQVALLSKQQRVEKGLDEKTRLLDGPQEKVG